MVSPGLLDDGSLTLTIFPHVRDYNAVARLTNSSLAVAVDSQLIPLRTRRNQEIEDFPATQGDINRLSC